MQSKLIDRQDRKSITEEVNLRKFLNNILYVIKWSITPHLTDDMTFDEIVIKSEKLEVANRGTNAEHSKQEYLRKLHRYPEATSAHSTNHTEQPTADKSQPQQKRHPTPGGRATASAVTKNSDWNPIRNSLSEQEQTRLIPEKACLSCGLAGPNDKDYRKRLNK